MCNSQKLNMLRNRNEVFTENCLKKTKEKNVLLNRNGKMHITEKTKCEFNITSNISCLTLLSQMIYLSDCEILAYRSLYVYHFSIMVIYEIHRWH